MRGFKFHHILQSCDPGDRMAWPIYEVIATRRDKSLEAVGIRVMRIAAADILENMDEVLARITAGMRVRIEDKKKARRAHGAQMREGRSAPRSAPRSRN